MYMFFDLFKYLPCILILLIIPAQGKHCKLTPEDCCLSSLHYLAIILLLDDRKLFNSLDYDIFIHKLLNIGLQDDIINWFGSYSNRIQYVPVQ